MNSKPALARVRPPAITRLSGLAPLGESEIALLEAAARTPQRLRAHRELIAEGQPNPKPAIVLSGWMCRTRIFSDGRRQILSLLLPGDIFGHCRQENPLAVTSIGTLTEASIISAPAAEPDTGQSALTVAYDRGGALEEACLFRQIARLGRFNAYERMSDWLLEMHERLDQAGIAEEGRFPMPLTQEALADILGLTSVHVNRTLQLMRREELIDLRGGMVRLLDRQRLADLVSYRPLRVSASD